MKVIKYINLFRYLTQMEELKPSEVYRNIQRIRLLPPELKEAVFDVMSSLCPNISYEGVSFVELTEEEKMKPIRAIFMLDWIRREPLAAMQYLSKERLRHRIILKEEEKNDSCEQEDKSDIVF